MPEVLTEELLHELLAHPNLDNFLDKSNLSSKSLSETLTELMQAKGLSKSEIIKRTTINETHAYQIFQGSRMASRNKVLQLARAMELDIRQTNRLLHSAGVSSLYCKCKRDAIIIFCVEHNYTIQQIDDELYKFGEETLSDE